MSNEEDFYTSISQAADEIQNEDVPLIRCLNKLLKTNYIDISDVVHDAYLMSSIAISKTNKHVLNEYATKFGLITYPKALIRIATLNMVTKYIEEHKYIHVHVHADFLKDMPEDIMTYFDKTADYLEGRVSEDKVWFIMNRIIEFKSIYDGSLPNIYEATDKEIKCVIVTLNELIKEHVILDSLE